jgi:hypothetical protein
MQLSRIDRFAQRLALRKQVFLSHELIERSGPHPISQGPQGIGRAA